MTRQYKSEALAAAHEAALGLAEAGDMSKRTMRVFDETCLTPVREMTPEDIRNLRLREHASQAVFAHYLNVTTGLVSQWERGKKRPRIRSTTTFPAATGDPCSSTAFRAATRHG